MCVLQGETEKPVKKFHFAWDDLLEDVQEGMSDVTVSSVHTSDLSSFEEEELSDLNDSRDLESERTGNCVIASEDDPYFGFRSMMQT